jgi:hypothetical protein
VVSDAAEVEPPLKRACRRDPDFSLLDRPSTPERRVCVVGEAKRPAVMQRIGADLVSKWNDQDSTARQAVAQLYEYMQTYDTIYGCITGLAYTWVARRHPEHPTRLQVCSSHLVSPVGVLRQVVPAWNSRHRPSVACTCAAVTMFQSRLLCTVA